MLSLFSFTNDSFEAFTMEHFLPIILGIVFAWGCIIIANRRLNEKQQTLLGTFLALLPFSCIIGRMTYLLLDGSFDVALDLPFILATDSCWGFYIFGCWRVRSMP